MRGEPIESCQGWAAVCGHEGALERRPCGVTHFLNACVATEDSLRSCCYESTTRQDLAAFLPDAVEQDPYVRRAPFVATAR